MKDKKDNKGARATSRKRGSISTSNSGLVSPALRPKVSPSIKPLLPEGANLHSSTHALLLASKSNYQNLLEGNHLPGISYPDSLSTGLTSKRTSHKVAEQGRRNRINDALKEMQALIPASSGARAEELMTSAAADDDSLEAKEKDRDAAVKSNSSKAATVESANRYIRVLKDSDAAQKAAIAKLTRELEEMRGRLGESKGTSVAEEGDEVEKAPAAAAEEAKRTEAAVKEAPEESPVVVEETKAGAETVK